ncbi:purine-nucleoside phosphorylase [bacterium]|nr:MAG: purine-nucleoside phosphorylase [bacterium]
MPIHLRSEKGDYAPVVLLAGDPGRVEFIGSFLENARKVNTHRGLLGITGEYNGKRISIQTHGMGTPSCAIVMEELIQLGCETFIRLGTCGGVQDWIRKGDIVVVTGAAPANGATLTYSGGIPPACSPDLEITALAYELAKKENLRVHAGPVATVDVFYNPHPDYVPSWKERGILAFEMEASVIFYLALRYRKRAACLLTVSDVVGRSEELIDYASPEELQRAQENLIKLGLELAWRIA